MTTRTRSIIVTTTVLVLYLLLFIVLGKHAFHDDHDNLDYYVANLAAAQQSGDLWNLDPNSVVAPILGGLPRFCFHHNLDFIMVLFTFFSPLVAFLINLVIVHVVGFVGMAKLLENHVLGERKTPIIIFGTALLFALLPLYPMLGITFSGVPMLCNAILNILKKKPGVGMDYLSIIFFTFYSSFVYVGVFVIIALGIAFIYNWWRSKKFDFLFVKVIAVLGFFYCLFNYFLIYQLAFAKGFVSDRVEWVAKEYNIKVSLWAAFDMLLHGHYHAESSHLFVLLIAVPLGLLLAIRQKKSFGLFKLLLVLIIVCSGFYGLWQWTPVVAFKEKFMLLKIFKWDRFYFFNPSLWYLLMAIATSYIFIYTYKKFPVGRWIVTGLLILQGGYILLHDKIFMQNIVLVTEKIKELSPDTKRSLLTADYARYYKSKTNTYEGFFQEELFTEVKEKIGKPLDSYRIAAIGFKPGTMYYNGLYTLDGYMTSYPLSYKHEFRKIIEKELAKNETARELFDGWGSKCYIMVDDVLRTKPKISNLELDFEQMKRMNCNYLLSTLQIENNDSLGLELMGTFNSQVNSSKMNLYFVR